MSERYNIYSEEIAEAKQAMSFHQHQIDYLINRVAELSSRIAQLPPSLQQQPADNPLRNYQASLQEGGGRRCDPADCHDEPTSIKIPGKIEEEGGD